MESGCIAASDTTETKGTWVARKFTEKKNHVAGVTDTEEIPYPMSGMKLQIC